MSGKTILVWFRKDLRIHDNEILTEAVRKGDTVVPVYCFDPRQFETTSFQTQKTGAIRARFLIECVADLQQSLQKLGADLIIRKGKPEDILPELVGKYNVSEVYHHREVASEETRISADVENALWRLKINLKHFIGHTLYHKEDLPFPINNIPDVFSSFRKKIERDSSVRKCIESPGPFKIPQDMECGLLPSLPDLGFQGIGDAEERSVMKFRGGETEALKRMHNYFWETDAIKNYKHTRNNLLGPDYSSKFSAWIALGCLSPREVYWEIKKYEQERGSSDSTYALYLQLLWRDYFRFMFKKYGNKFFQKIGFKGVAPEETENQQDFFEFWRAGKTGIPFVDANIRELNTTGFMSNRGRQNAASFLVRNLKVNWMWGASYFEEKLIDYCPANNWGNWAYIAGVGNDPKEYQHFNVLKQAREFDPNGDYVRMWIPELAMVPGAKIHQPWTLSDQEVREYHVEDYKARPAFAPEV
ncbi:DASH family cryptochrome [Daejeonella lutea]|uniref:Cryptochrome DASH n=1 Tax=Daejeonella lutea TaxID=572036 RepID=A0A1T5EFX9_9SPHI|nr:DASH family cryptochrome [Daejeonella lutea]SKB82913.1 deoxyribodipyrimidine photo-lyase (single-stranded DNA-specific) [Daejeonella lutea]